MGSTEAARLAENIDYEHLTGKAILAAVESFEAGYETRVQEFFAAAPLPQAIREFWMDLFVTIKTFENQNDILRGLKKKRARSGR